MNAKFLLGAPGLRRAVESVVAVAFSTLARFGDDQTFKRVLWILGHPGAAKGSRIAIKNNRVRNAPSFGGV